MGTRHLAGGRFAFVNQVEQPPLLFSQVNQVFVAMGIPPLDPIGYRNTCQNHCVSPLVVLINAINVDSLLNLKSVIIVMNI